MATAGRIDFVVSRRDAIFEASRIAGVAGMMNAVIEDLEVSGTRGPASGWCLDLWV